MTLVTRISRCIAAVALTAALCLAQGVELKRSAVVLSGSDANCSHPAVISFEKVRDATEEWQKIQADGVREGSARYRILMNKMMQRIRAAARAAAGDAGIDLVVREGDISDDRGLTVEDITDDVVDAL
jgi:Skp family chaperone for outer membrane proteins